VSDGLTTLERALLTRIQHGFPLAPDPYGELAQAVGCAREEAHAAVQRLRARGIIRRIGGSFVASALGYVSVLIAAQVATEHLDAVAHHINSYPEVTHNYARDGKYNLWFTVIAASAERLQEIVAAVRAAPGVQMLATLPAERTFKLRVDFAFPGGMDAT
jgi:DNA-binding Lrp family transcriptional regulator